MPSPFGSEPLAETNPRLDAKFSVLVISHQRPKLLDQALQTLASQTCRDFDVLIVDSGALYQRLVAKYYGKAFGETRIGFDDGIRPVNIEVVESGEPKGLSRTCCPPCWILNRFIDRTKGHWIIHLCDDDLLLPTYLESFDWTLTCSNDPQCAYTGQLRVAATADGRIDRVKKIADVKRFKGPRDVDCKVDALQFAFNRPMWELLKTKYPEPFPTGRETQHHADGVFMTRATRVSKAIPVLGLNCINRRTPSSQFTGTI